MARIRLTLAFSNVAKSVHPWTIWTKGDPKWPKWPNGVSRDVTVSVSYLAHPDTEYDSGCPSTRIGTIWGPLQRVPTWYPSPDPYLDPLRTTHGGPWDSKGGCLQTSRFVPFCQKYPDPSGADFGANMGQIRSRGYLPMDPQIRGSWIPPVMQDPNPNMHSEGPLTSQGADGPTVGLLGPCRTCQIGVFWDPPQNDPIWDVMGTPKLTPFGRHLLDLI